MNIRSAKQKGKRCAEEVKKLLIKNHPALDGNDIYPTPSSVPGKDIHLSQHALNVYPLAIECKNQESLNIWKALEQADTYVKENLIATVFFKRNRSELFVALRAEAFIKLLSELHDKKISTKIE